MSTALVPTKSNLAVLNPLGSLDHYVQTVTAIPVLSVEEEQRLAREYVDGDDLDAARDLIVSNLRFVVHIARGYGGYGLNLGDLIQEGNIGLMKAVKRFDPDVGVRLVSFAVHWIRAEIHEFVLRNWRLVKVATTKAQRKLFFNLRKAKNRLGWLSHEETKAVAKDLGVSVREVSEMEQRLAARDLSFEQPADGDDDKSSYGPAAYLPSPEIDPAQALEESDWQRAAGEKLTAGLRKLDDRSMDIVQRRWLADHKTTLQQLATEYGISAERIRQIENNAIKKLKSFVMA